MSEIVVSKNAMLIRIFLWAWKADPEKLNGCKLVWGFVFIPLAFVGKVSAMGAAYLAVSLLLLLFRLEGASAVFALVGVAAILFDLVRNCRKSSKEKEDMLDKIASKEYVMLEYVDVFFYKIMHFIVRFSQTRLGRYTGKSIVLIYDLYNSAKRYCPLIRLV